MKLLKAKSAAALLLAGLMFGMLSFTTTPVAAQDTSSVNVTETGPDDKRLPLLQNLGRLAFAAGIFAVAYLASLVGNPNVQAMSQYPAESLD